MAFILNIDTATETASVSLARNGIVTGSAINPDQKDHASWIHTAMEDILRHQQTRLSAMDAIAVVAGPGSYTGLRVGLATAKGLCYTINKPLILLNTLNVLAKGMAYLLKEISAEEDILLAPMIDARRMEVFTALYSSDLQEIRQPAPMILTGESFSQELERTKILFAGSGSEKWKKSCQHNNAIFSDQVDAIRAMAELSRQLFDKKQFADIAYSEPSYLKEFFNAGLK